MRQRAIYSEALVPPNDDGNSSASTANAHAVPRAMAGPSRSNEMRSAQEATYVVASVFKQKNRPSVKLDVQKENRYADVDPKVCESYKAVPGRPPRRVQVERLRRRYESQDITELLEAHGLRYSDPMFEKDCCLPLDPFDDSEYDVRTPREWLELGKDGTGRFLPLPAQALLYEAGCGHWRRALVSDYDNRLQQFEVRWDEGGLERRGPEMLPRLRVLFAAEDPVLFAERCAAAHTARRFAELMIRYNFYIDNMPTDDVQTLNIDQVERMLESVRKPTGGNEEESDAPDIGAVLQEIQLDFARTMNRIVFDVHLLDQRADNDPMHKGLRAMADRSPVASAVLRAPSGFERTPMQALVPIPPHRFAETFAELCLATLRVRPEVVVALHKIKEACERVVRDGTVYHTSFRKPLRLEEFRQLQRTTLQSAHYQLKSLWTAQLHQIVLTEFSSVGKGWFNINETSRDLYRRGKLVRFLALIRLIMQDTLREIAECSVESYSNAIDAMVPLQVEVESLNTTICTYPESYQKADPTQDGPSQLFCLEALSREGHDHSAPKALMLSVEPARFVAAILETFDAGLSSLNDVPALENLVLPHLSKTMSSSQLSGVDIKAEWVVEARQKLQSRVNSALPSLDDFLTLLREYEDLMKLNPVTYVNSFSNRDPPPEDSKVQEEIEKQMEKQRDLLEDMPETAHVGLFQVGCKDLRRRLANTREQIVKLLLDLLLQRLRTQMNETMDGFQAIASQLRKLPRNIEELVDMRRFAESVPRQVTGLKDKITRDVCLYERIESLYYKVPNEDFRQRWHLAGATRDTLELVVRALRALQKQQEEFTKQMVQEQADFWATLDDIDQVIWLFREKPEFQDIERFSQIAEDVDNVCERLEKAEQQARLYNSREVLLGMPCTDYSRLQESHKVFEPYSALWQVVNSWLTNKDQWRNGSLLKIDARFLQREVFNGVKQLHRVCRLLQHEDDQKDVLLIAERTHRELDEFRPCVPLVVALRTEGMSMQHWNEISEIVGQTINPDMQDFTLYSLLADPYRLQDHCETVQAIADRAAKEFSIEYRLRQMNNDWDGVFFGLEPYRDTGTYILKGIDVVSALLDEQLVGIQSLQFSPFKGRLSDEIDAWALKLRHMSDHLEEWSKCQRMWLYLQPIFDSADVMRQLPAESRRFKSVDSFWRNVMKFTETKHKSSSLHALTCLLREGFEERWVEANHNLEAVQRSLEDYLQTKRAKFSRFYFLSNDELLEIISQTKEPKKVQPFLKKIYESMGSLEFEDDLGITAMFSPDGEEIRFAEKVSANDVNVEIWMREVEAAMFQAVRISIKTAMDAYSRKPRTVWLMEHPAQAVLTAAQTHWASEVDAGLSCSNDARRDPKAGIRNYLVRLEKQLTDTVGLMRSGQNLNRSKVTVGALIVQDVHQKDIVSELVSAGVTSSLAFEWASKMRCCWGTEHEQAGKFFTGINPRGVTEQPDIWVKCLQTNFPYGHEYLGNTSRLVITPLTDQCYMTLLCAQVLNLGGAPMGPAGTGKTETTKELAKAVAKRCIVFNCSEGMDYIMVGSFFKGLAISGFWCCFDEFNRIDVEVLSVVAQQLLVLFGAKAELTQWCATKAVDFEGSLIAVSRTFSVFVTMNPGYAHRHPLPDNLRALFRPVSMMVPDYSLIAEIVLYSYGFESARELARKVIHTFRLASEQLSAQGHYDYGMRAVRAVVDAAGHYKHTAEVQARQKAVAPAASPTLQRQLSGSDEEGSKAQSNDGQEDASQEQPIEEQQLLLHALHDVNMPKFLEQDAPRFQDIVRDLFPGKQHKPIMDPILDESFRLVCKDLGVQNVPSFRAKVHQLHSTVLVRHGVMLVGPAGGGKTCCSRTLQQMCCNIANSAQSEEHASVKMHVLNPKAVTLGQLYGDFNVTTHEWRDGILAGTMRTAAQDTSGQWHWVMFDGPVDPEWVENMNTVLDDNRKLCLNSSEIIQLTSEITVMFEVEDLEAASPATVSRCGMVYMEPSAIGFVPLVKSWLESLPEALKVCLPRLEQLCSVLLEPMLAFVRGPNCTEILISSDGGLCMAMLNLLECILRPYCASASFEYSTTNAAQDNGGFRMSTVMTAGILGVSETPENVELPDLQSHLDHIFLFALIWSVGASCDTPSRKAFETQLAKQIDKIKVSLVNATNASGGESIYDRAYQPATGKWVHWMETVPDFEVDPSEHHTYEDLVIPTVDSIRTEAMMKYTLLGGKHVLCPGPPGTGKSTIISGLLRDDRLPSHSRVSVTLSAHTRANEFQDLLDSSLEKRRRGVYGPPAGKRCVFFVDDLNMPCRDGCGSQPPLELLRQWFDHGGWYRCKELAFCQVLDVLMVGAMGPTGGGRQPISKRLTRHYHCLALPELKQESVRTIFNTLVMHFCADFPAFVMQLVGDLALVTTTVFEKVQKELLPTPDKTHYTFNLRDVWRIFQGICSLNGAKMNERETMARAWCHECTRVFGDRFVSKSDQDWLQNQLVSCCEQDFGVPEDIIFKLPRLIFSCITSGAVEALADHEVDYTEVEDLQSFVETVVDKVEEYNASMTLPMFLTMFLDACEHVARICRVLRLPDGNCLLIGIGGSGRQSLGRLSSFCMGCETTQIEVGRRYGFSDWRSDVKGFLMKAGLEHRPQCFLLCDQQFFDEAVVEDINSLLNSGDILNLYAADDLENIMQSCTKHCHDLHLEATKANIYNVYLQRVRRQSHMILACSPASKDFRARLRMFPALVNCCTMDWFFPWPADALFSVASQQLPSHDSMHLEPADYDRLLQLFSKVHLSAEKVSKSFAAQMQRYSFVTPSSYLELLRLFTQILQQQRTKNQEKQSHLKAGVDKLEGAVTQVEVMKGRLLEMTPILEQTKKDVALMMAKLEEDKVEADKTREWIGQEEAEAQLKDLECRAKHQEAERDLQLAMPALDEAVDVLKKLKESQIREVKAMRQPPAGVELAMTAVCVMLGVPPVRKPGARPGERVNDYWEVVHTTLLKDPKKFRDDLLNYNKDAISEETIRRIQPYLEREDFEPSQIRKSSVACEAIAMWVRAMCKYHEISKTVEPKRMKLRVAQVEYEKTKTALESAQKKLTTAVKRVQHLEEEFAEKLRQNEELVQQTADCEAKIERAQRLMAGLGGERSRWTDLCLKLRNQYYLLPGDSVFCAGLVAYAASFTSEYRHQLEKVVLGSLNHAHIQHTDSDLSLRRILGDSEKIQEWQLCGLPDDAYSIENGIMMDTVRLCPFMIDPQKQANLFIKNLGKKLGDGLEVVKQSQGGFQRALEHSLQTGRWLLLENMAVELDQLLEPILEQRRVKERGEWVVHLGDKTVAWHSSFRLLMTTTMENPSFSPEAFSKVTVLNFAITQHGLEEQMLALVVSKESPDLEQKREELRNLDMQMEKELADAEAHILQMLTTSEGNILDDEMLVDALAASRRTSTAINEKMEEVRHTEAEIERARAVYANMAGYIAMLFFVVDELTHVDPMYQFSLQWFQQLFLHSVEEAHQTNVLNERIDYLTVHFTYKLYCNVTRAIFDQHKLLFSFRLCLKTMERENRLDQHEVRYLVTGSSSSGKGEVHAHSSMHSIVNPHTLINPTDFLSPEEWHQVCALGKISAFTGIEVSFDVVRHEWKRFHDAPQAEDERLPGAWEHKVGRFQRLCLLRAVRIDCLERAIAAYVEKELGHQFIDPPAFSLSACYQDATNITPLIFILAGGADPAADVLALAKEVGMEQNFESISLGQGQGERAKRLIEEGSLHGSWVLLCNCHLCVSWMPELESLCDGLHPELAHRDFRLWLTSAPTTAFPESVLQNGVKMTNTPPPGIRANLLQTFTALEEHALDRCPMVQVHRRLVFGLCFFHAILIERRRFGPIGFNVNYRFTPEDLAVCRRQLRVMLTDVENNGQGVPYKAIRLVCAGVHYGGHVTDDQDRKLIETIARRYMCRELAEGKDQYMLSSNPVYYAPEAETREEYIDQIARMPMVDAPEVFGLHENSRIVCQQQGSRALISGLLEMAPHYTRFSSSRRSAVEDAIQHEVQALQERTPDIFDEDELWRKRSSAVYTGANSMTVVLILEVSRYNRLLSTMKATLESLNNALSGIIVMSQDLEDMLLSLQKNCVPTSWAAVGFLSMKPLASWVRDVQDRVAFFAAWVNDGVPAVYWLSACYFPQGFLSSTIQSYARRNSLPVDRVSFKFHVMERADPFDDSIVEPLDGCYTYGYFLEGCRYNNQTQSLAPSLPREFFFTMPLLWFMPAVDWRLPKGVRDSYMAPVYKVPSRQGVLSTTGASTNFVTVVDLPSRHDVETWILAGVALLLSLSS